MTGRDQFKKIKIIITTIAKIFSVFGYRGNYYLLRMFRNTNGRIGLVLRYTFLKNCAGDLGDNVSIQPGVFLFNPNKISFGNNISIHPMCYIEGAGGITISDNVSIAHSSTLISANHTWSDPSIPIKYNLETFSPILIEEDVWIGCAVRILAGVKIGRRSIVAAGAVVTKSFEQNAMIAGIPAKIIKKINEN